LKFTWQIVSSGWNSVQRIRSTPVITDPPFGLREYTRVELAKRRAGRGGVWRIPPSFDGSNRAPLPRFTVLNGKDLATLFDFFHEWGTRLLPVLVPGGHVFIAANPLLSHVVWNALVKAGFEKRGEIVRLVRTFRGGDRPKGAEAEFSSISSMPRACWEPWGLFRRPFKGRLADNLRQWAAGGLRRPAEDYPLLRRHRKRSHSQSRARDRSPSEPKTSTLPAPACLGSTSSGYR